MTKPAEQGDKAIVYKLRTTEHDFVFVKRNWKKKKKKKSREPAIHVFPNEDAH